MIGVRDQVLHQVSRENFYHFLENDDVTISGSIIAITFDRVGSSTTAVDF